MENVQFDPKDLTVKVGETITFTNNEAVPHDVHKTSGPEGTSPPGTPAACSRATPSSWHSTSPASTQYVCKVHAPGMAGTITVK